MKNSRDYNVDQQMLHRGSNIDSLCEVVQCRLVVKKSGHADYDQHSSAVETARSPPLCKPSLQRHPPHIVRDCRFWEPVSQPGVAW